MPKRSDYRSNALSAKKVREALAAHSYAELIGRPLDFTLDIHWEFTRFAKEGVWNRRKAVPALLANLRRWLGYRNVGLFSIAVRESPPSSSAGEHLHLLLHLPPHLQAPFLRKVRKFLRGKQRLPKNALAWDRTYNSGKLAYMLKGCTPPARTLIQQLCKTDFERQAFEDATKGKTRQGVIYGKRLLISQSLGPKAQRGEKRGGNVQAEVMVCRKTG